MVVKVAVDNNILGYVGETEERITKYLKTKKAIEKSLVRMEYSKIFAKIVCSNPRIKAVVPILVMYEFRKAPPEVRINVKKYMKCFHWSVNERTYKKALNINIPPKLKHIKESDLRILIESSYLRCRYFITYDSEDLIKNENLIRKELKKLKISVPKIITPEEFINLLHILK